MATRTEERTPIQAYAKLQGENFVYYIQTLSVTLGRRVAGSEGVDVDLGSAKTISRTHARIEYDFDSRKFMMVPVGKNGVTINGKLHTPGDTIPLDTRTAIQIGDVCFYFLLPIGPVNNSVRPAPKAPVLNLGHLFSRSPSPTELETHPNSSLPTRTNSRGNSPHAFAKTDGSFAAQLSEKLAETFKPARHPSEFSDDGSLAMKHFKSDMMPAPLHTPAAARKARAAPAKQKKPQQPVQQPRMPQAPQMSQSHVVDMTPASPPPPPDDGDEPWCLDHTVKPPYSYATMIAQAIWASPTSKTTLSGIYKYIMTTYKYYDMDDPSGWQNSIRHNLSLNKAFVRIPRGPNEPGKGAFWGIDPKATNKLKASLYRKRSRGPKHATGKVRGRPKRDSGSRRSSRKAAPKSGELDVSAPQTPDMTPLSHPDDHILGPAVPSAISSTLPAALPASLPSSLPSSLQHHSMDSHGFGSLLSSPGGWHHDSVGGGGLSLSLHSDSLGDFDSIIRQ